VRSEADGSGAVRVVNDLNTDISFALTREGIYYCGRGPRPNLQFFGFASAKSRALLTLEKPLNIGITVSPDGRWLIYSQMERAAGSNLMLVDNFR